MYGNWIWKALDIFSVRDMMDIPRNRQDGKVVKPTPTLMVMDITHDKVKQIAWKWWNKRNGMLHYCLGTSLFLFLFSFSCKNKICLTSLALVEKVSSVSTFTIFFHVNRYFQLTSLEKVDCILLFKITWRFFLHPFMYQPNPLWISYSVLSDC